MGTGTNVQKRLIALHHLDAPWKPAEVEQREGRILRQGNTNADVTIYRYVTEGSFDAYLWQALETKARFIAQVMTGESAVRRADDIGGQELSYAEVKAIASGNPAVLTLAETEAELQRLSILRKNHDDEQFLARRKLRELPLAITGLTASIEGLSTDLDRMKQHSDQPIEIQGRSCPADQVHGRLNKLLDALPEILHATQRVPLGNYRGLVFGIVLHQHFPPEVYLEGAITRQVALSEHRGARAVLNAVERLATGYPEHRQKAVQEHTIAENQLRDYQSRLGKTFEYDEYLSALIQLRDQLKLGLSVNAAEPQEGQPTVGELVEKITTLRASNTIESTTERVARPRAAAEEPVTSRIRRNRTPETPMIEEKPSLETSEIPPLHLFDPETAVPVSSNEQPVLTTDEQPSAALTTRPQNHPAFTDPRVVFTIRLNDGARSPTIQLRRSYRFKQMQIYLEGESFHDRDLGVLTRAGWIDRTETEGVWTKQMPTGMWQPVADAERFFLSLANAIRRRNGLEPVSPSFSSNRAL
jgi:hypothetical protein